MKMKEILAVFFLSLLILGVPYRALAQEESRCLSEDEMTEEMTGYSIYEGKVYFFSCPVNDADPDTFHELNEKETGAYGLAEDGRSVFRAGKKLEGLKPGNYKIKKVEYIDPDDEKPDELVFIYDGNNFFLYSIKIPDTLDVNTVEVITPDYFKDQYHVYQVFYTQHRVERVDGADPDYFSFGYKVAPDAVYWYGRKIKEADPGSFEVGIGYDHEMARDKNNVYNEGNVIYGADTKSFQIYRIPVSDNEALYAHIDKNNYYNPLTLAPEKSLASFETEHTKESSAIGQSVDSYVVQYESKYPGYTPQPARPPYQTKDLIRYSLIALLLGGLGVGFWKKAKKRSSHKAAN